MGMHLSKYVNQQIKQSNITISGEWIQVLFLDGFITISDSPNDNNQSVVTIILRRNESLFCSLEIAGSHVVLTEGGHIKVGDQQVMKNGVFLIKPTIGCFNPLLPYSSSYTAHGL